MTMRVSKNQGSHTWYTAEHERKLRRHAKPAATGGFDPNENPVIIGASATAGGGSTPSSVSGGATAAVAIGSSAQAIFADAISIGANAKTHASAGSGTGAVAIGYNSQTGASGQTASHAVAIGESSTAYDQSFAGGYGATATNTRCVAVGENALASADNAIAIGSGASATTNSSCIALGSTALATGDSSCALGVAAHATHINATALGKSAATDQDYQIKIGASAPGTTHPTIITLKGQVDLSYLPTSDPGVSGYAWNNSGVVTVSP